MSVDMPSHPFQTIPLLENWNNLKKPRVVARRWGFHSRKQKKTKKTLHVNGHAQSPLADHTSDSPRPKVFFFLDWNRHLSASTLGFFNLFWCGHAQSALPDHTSDSPGPKVFLYFFGFLDWNRHLPVSTIGFFNLFWFGHAQRWCWLPLLGPVEISSPGQAHVHSVCEKAQAAAHVLAIYIYIYIYIYTYYIEYHA
jgi:hypothetical protein